MADSPSSPVAKKSKGSSMSPAASFEHVVIAPEHEAAVIRMADGPRWEMLYGSKLRRTALEKTVAFIVVCWVIVIGVSAARINNLSLSTADSQAVTRQEFLQLAWYVGAAIVSFVIYSAIYEWKTIQYKRTQKAGIYNLWSRTGRQN